MESNHGSEPLHGLDDIDWTALAPERGSEIPDLLRGVATEKQEQSLLQLHEILCFPAPGHVAAPEVVEFLVRLAGETWLRGRHNVVNLLQELTVPSMADHLPVLRDITLWRDEIAWAATTDVEKVRAQYREWLADAPDEQQYRRIQSRLRALEHDNGTHILAAELAVHEAVRERLPALLELLEGRENRGGDAVAEWVAYILAWFPEEADLILPALVGAGDSSSPYPALRPLPAEVWAMGMLSDPADVTATVHLAQLLTAADSDLAFAAAVALAQIHGPAVPEQALALLTGSDYWEDHLGASLPQSGPIEPTHLGMLLLSGVDDEDVRQAGVGQLKRVFAYTGGEGQGVVAANALEMALGPRHAERAPATGLDGFETQQREVVAAIGDITADAWEEGGLAEVVTAWGLPGNRADFRSFAGLESDEKPAQESTPAPQAAPQAQQPEQGGLLGRFFGGGR
ncbi:hypothetical protein [Nocardiopsis ansamitocini]|uniref:Uncharacterized protein n=1 Tax=Nocardiopsis ansamitocini TaxID=1670832 RepID=A0A9W6P611_9ACTN|nr:hypothetical protein [Nocardiopsis ansamitocini]GLU47698.1 hypothetical protein Nans01_20490 [Nocardiopsis ansamitocini]